MSEKNFPKITESKITKNSIRRSIWTFLEEKNIARFPRPVFNRIPNFEGAAQACAKVQNLKEYRTARVVEVNPDSPQKHIRYLALEDKKVLLVPTPRLEKGILNQIIPPAFADKSALQICATHEGVRRYSSSIGLKNKIKVDVVILGSVAVSKKGRRIGKGEGYADMEFAMMSTMGAVNAHTTVITTVHDCQVMDDIPDELFGEHDLPVDIIATPTQIIYCETRLPKPTKIIWSLLTEKKLNTIPILKELKEMEEKGLF